MTRRRACEVLVGLVLAGVSFLGVLYQVNEAAAAKGEDGGVPQPHLPVALIQYSDMDTLGAPADEERTSGWDAERIWSVRGPVAGPSTRWIRPSAGLRRTWIA